MTFKLRRRTAIRAVSFLAAAAMILGGFLLTSCRRAARYERLLALTEQHAFAELSTAVSALDTALQKGTYASTAPMLCSLCGEIYAKAQMAQMAMVDLPYANVELEQTTAFLAQVGDYACALSQSAARNGALSQEEREGLAGLSAAAAALSQQIGAIQTQLSEGALDLERLEQATLRLAQAAQDGQAAVAGTAFQTMEEEFPELPTLVYDGPFSQHLTQRVPLGLEALDQVSQQEACQAAAAFLDLRPEILTLVSAGDGELPSYSFSAPVDGGEVYLEVTRQGGRVVELFTSRPVGQETVSVEQAMDAAARFLTAQGFPPMRASYYIDQAGLLTIHYAALQEEVLCYPDLVKVSVALDTGAVVGFEAVGYYWNHTQRILAAPALSPEEAQSRLDPLLTVLGVQQVVIPTPGEYEVACYEFKCQDSVGRHCLVYLNSDTGLEEQILILLEDESGTLVR